MILRGGLPSYRVSKQNWYTLTSPIMSHLIFLFWHFSPSFVVLKLTCLVTLFDRKLQVLKNSPNWTIFGIFNELLSTRNVNVARFARNVEWDFLGDFQTLCTSF